MTRTEHGALACALLAAGLVGYGVRVYAEGGPKLKPLFYAGTLLADGQPADGPHDITLTLYDAASAGNVLCKSTTPGADVSAGSFRVELADACVTVLRAKPDTYLEVSFSGSDHKVHTMARVKVGAVPYALEADHAVNATRATSSAKADSAAAGAADFNVAGDATVSGMLHVGAHAVTGCPYNPYGYTDCACAAGELAIAGGAYAGSGDFLAESRQLPASGTAASTWRVACSQPNGTRVECGSPHAICVRLGQ